MKNGKKIGLSIEAVESEHLGLYRVYVHGKNATNFATTELKYDFNHLADFKKLDEENENLITKEMMIQAMCCTDTYLTEKEIRKFVKNGDFMKADKVNYDEYVRYMKYAKRHIIRPPGRELQTGDEDKKKGGDDGGDGGEGEGEKKKEKKEKKDKKKKGEGEEGGGEE